MPTKILGMHLGSNGLSLCLCLYRDVGLLGRIYILYIHTCNLGLACSCESVIYIRTHAHKCLQAKLPEGKRTRGTSPPSMLAHSRLLDSSHSALRALSIALMLAVPSCMPTLAAVSLSSEGT